MKQPSTTSYRAFRTHLNTSIRGLLGVVASAGMDVQNHLEVFSGPRFNAIMQGLQAIQPIPNANPQVLDVQLTA